MTPVPKPGDSILVGDHGRTVTQVIEYETFTDIYVQGGCVCHRDLLHAQRSVHRMKGTR